MNLEQQLAKLSYQSLKTLVFSLYNVSDDVDEIIEQHIKQTKILEGSDAVVIDNYQQQLFNLINGQDYYQYFRAHEFAQKLGDILEDINTQIRQRSSTGALTLTEQFIYLTGKALEMVDDSGGEVGDIFTQASDQWLEIATDVRKNQPDYQDWSAKVRELYGKNDYGCLDDLISESHSLLTDDELMKMAETFEEETRQALDVEGQDDNLEAARASLGLRDVAEALDNVELFERSFTIISPQPTDLEMAEIVKFCLKIKDLERAQYWLEQSGWNRQHLHQQLTEKVAQFQS